MENQSGNGESSFLLPSWIHAKIISLEPSLSRKKKRRKGGEKKRKKKKSIPSEGTHFPFHLWTSFSFQFLPSPYFLSRVEIHFNPFLTFYYIYIYFYITFRSNFSNRIVFDRKKKKKKKNLSSILPTMLTKKKKKKINLRSRRIYFHVTFQSFRIILSLSLSIVPTRLCEANIYRAVSPVPRATKS